MKSGFGQFCPVAVACEVFAERWTPIILRELFATVRVDQRHLDAAFLMWNVRRRIARELLPSRRVVVRFSFSGVPAAYRGPRLFWLMLEPGQVDLCIEDPGFEVDLYVEADLAAMARVWLGDVQFESVLRSNEVRLVGPRDLAKAFPSWLMLSKFAGVPRPRGALATAGSG